jgi:hypothetical protein
MSVLFQRPQGPTKINTVQMNQSNLGYPVPVVMGKGKVQQTVLWVDGFTWKLINASGGKGFGGKDGNQYVYSTDLIAGLCDGGAAGIVGIGDVWGGQSWLQNTNTAEDYTISGGSPTYTPVNSFSMTGDHGVGYLVPISASYSDLTAPSTTVLATSIIVPFQRVTFGTTLTQGTYSIDPSNNVYHFSTLDSGTTVTLNYTFALGTLSKQQIDLIPSGRNVVVNGSLPFVSDVSVVYFNTGSTDGEPLTRVSGTPTVAGTYQVDPGSYTVTGHPGAYTVTVVRAANYTFSSADIGQEVRLTYKLNNTSALPAGTQTSLSFELIPGTPLDTPAALLLSKYPGAALGYSGIVKILYAPMDLGYGAQIQQNTFEVITADGWGGGIVDCNPVQCLLQVLSNPVWGLGRGAVPFPLSAIDNGEFGTWGNGNAGNGGNGVRAYVVPRGGPAHVITEDTATAWFAANSFFISPVIDRQDTAASLLGKWLEAGMCMAYMSEGLMKLVGLGDTSATGNGATWTAPSSFDAELDDTCFLAKSQGQDPVKISSSPWTEAFNKVQISWNNRGNQYAPEITPEEDKSAVNRYGDRIEDPQSYDFITTLAAARFAGSMRVKRNVYTRNTYTFSLPFRFGHLEPLGVISLTTNSAWSNANNNTIQLVRQPVRITKIIDNPDGTYDVTCEDFIFGTQQPGLNNKGTGSGNAPPNQYADPGNTSVALLIPTPQLAGGFNLNQLWIGAAGQTDNWGGCNIWASTDGLKFGQIGTIEGPARLGTLSAIFPTGSDPDTTNSLVVNLVDNAAPLEAGTSADADLGNTLCVVDGELIAISASVLTGIDQYTAGTYIRRGQKGSSIAGHSVGAPFLRLDSSIFKYTFDPAWSGEVVYLKFQSFNFFGNSIQDLSTVTAIPITLYTFRPGTVVEFNGTEVTTTPHPRGGPVLPPPGSRSF